MTWPPVIWAALSYLLVATVALWPSIGPGRTLVPSDALIIATPYSALPTAHEPHNLQLSDATFQFFPWFHFVADGMRDGEIRQWNPTLLGGVRVSPNGNVSPYYPLSWLGGAMSAYDAYDLFVLLHLVIGALGVYVLGRALGIRPLPAWVSGLLAFTAAFWVNWSTHLVHVAGMVWVPWALAATWWLLAAPSRRRVAALAAVVGMWLLGGSPQYVYYGGLALAGWAGIVLVGRRMRGSRGEPGALFRPAVAFALAMVLGVLVAAPALLPTLATSGRVVRTRESEAQTAHVPLDDAIRLVVPNATGNGADTIFYGSSDELRMDSPFLGVTALLLAGAGFGGLGRTGKRRLLLVAATAAVMVLAFSGLPHRLLYEVVPGYDRFRSSPRWLFLLPAFALQLAALGLQDLLSGMRRARMAMLTTGVLAGVAVVVWFAYEQTQPGAPTIYFRNRAVFALALIGTVLGAGWLARSRPRLAVTAMVVVALGEILFHTQRWYPRIDKSTAYPDTVVSDLVAMRGGRFVTVGVRSPFPPFAPDVSMVYGAADAHGLSVLFPKDYDRYLRLIDDYGLYAEEFNLAPSLATGDMLDSPLLDVLDVRTILAERDVPIPGRYRLLVPPSVEPWVYERPSPGGAMVVVSASPTTEAEMWARVAARDWDPRASAAVPALPAPVQGQGGTVTPRTAPPDRELWEVDAPGGGFLRVGARWDEGWSATVDGRATAVLRADGVFRGVVVPPGRHVVRFTYRNPDEMRGRAVAAAALVVLVGLLGPWPEFPSRRQPNARSKRLHG